MAANKKRALVAGGTGALGSSVASALLRDGYEVHVTSGFPEEAARLRPVLAERGITVHLANLGREAEVAEIIRSVGTPLAALVCTVGAYRGGPLAQTPVEDIDFLIQVNLRVPVLLLKGAHASLKGNQGGAAVVLVSARGALTGGPGSAVYAATKAAVANLALSAAQEWQADGICVNAVLPSTMDTPANRQAMPGAEFSRWPKTDEVAEVIAFLVSEKARIVSGGAIPVYGKA